MEVGEEGEYIYTYRYTVTTRMIPALRWAAMTSPLAGRRLYLPITAGRGRGCGWVHPNTSRHGTIY